MSKAEVEVEVQFEVQQELAIGLQGLQKKYKADTNHAKQVTALSEILFRELAPLHGLSDGRLDWLRAAALLHDLGHFINERGHHRHSHHIISHDPALSTWPPAARDAIALVALNHRKARAKGLEALSKTDLREIRAITALLRIADVLDVDHRQDVTIEAVTHDAAEHVLVLSVKHFDPVAHAERLQRKVGWAAELWQVAITVDNGKQSVRITC
ncbi:MAG: HD domain-containing protein [Candidatus Sericytochromatia bacterium]|nr:HD domain-containing protein [Candidatus Sericytochromatia bacterium]